MGACLRSLLRRGEGVPGDPSGLALQLLDQTGLFWELVVVSGEGSRSPPPTDGAPSCSSLSFWNPCFPFSDLAATRGTHEVASREGRHG